MCVVSQRRGMLFQPAGALRRAWAAVWFAACTTGGGVRQLCLDLALAVSLSVGEYTCTRQKHTHRCVHQTTNVPLYSTCHHHLLRPLLLVLLLLLLQLHGAGLQLGVCGNTAWHEGAGV